MRFFTIEKIAGLLPEIRQAIYRENYPVQGWEYTEGASGDPHRPTGDSWQPFEPSVIEGRWGGLDIEAWFRATVEIPPRLRDEKLVLRFLVGPRDGGHSTAETMVYVNGRPLQGVDIWHEEVWLPPELVSEGRVLVELHAWSGILQPPPRRQFKLANLIRIDEAAERFYYLASTIHRAIVAQNENDLRRVRLLDALNDAFLRIDFLELQSDSFYQSVAEAETGLREAIERLPRDELKPTITAIGHAHIDMAWLWRLRHTREKAARTFATVLHLMDQYPEYRFIHSSPQLYKFLEEDYPQLFDRVRERIRSGEWEITGGMWVEPDVNLPGGESLVRQFLLGKRYMRETFGVESTVVWLPDVFGYSYALPQIMKKCGMEYFMTTKISWSQFNRFPYDTFMWRGLDGTEILTHFVTTPEPGSPYYTYNGQLNPAEVRGIWEQYRQKDVNEELLLIFGWGDGGGGPTREMLESARAMASLPGIPSVRMGHAEPYFKRLAARVSGEALPVWDGELYLEYHRGTYTSQAQVKRANREAEIQYHNAEWLSTLTVLLAGGVYPHQRLTEGWERILLNQFHDILPGSSIREVYQDAGEDYHWISRRGEEIIEDAIEQLAAGIHVEQPSFLLLNPLGWRRGGLVEVPIPDGDLPAASGESASLQRVDREGEQRILLHVPDVPSLGYTTLTPGAEAIGTLEEKGLTVTEGLLENEYYRIALNERGQIASLYDKRYGREVLAPGKRGNVFQTFEDRPMAFDAWDIDLYYQEKVWEVEDLVDRVVEEQGPLRGVLRLRWRFHNSTITQRVTIYRNSPRIDFRTEVEWREKQILLKVAFPVNIRATRATYEIQFGNIERPAHWNTSWDWARFEVVGHRWADLSEGNYGVALLNDSKYGHDIKDNVMRLTLIKSSVRPDPEADRGYHHFTYSLLPHAGGWREGNVTREAYELNYPLLVRRLPRQEGVGLPPQWEFATLDCDHVILETVKQAEEGNGWIVRVYEFEQARNERVVLTFPRGIRHAVECNLIEEEERSITWKGNCLFFSIAPFEIKTFKVRFEEQDDR